jgi:hypothetical protein
MKSKSLTTKISNQSGALFFSTVISGISFLTISVLSCSTAYAATLYTNSASFISQLEPGYYLENFNAKSGGALASGTTFTNGLYTYTVSTSDTNGLYITPVSGVGGSNALSTNDTGFNIVVNFTSNNVTAVGGNFFLTDVSGDPIANSFSIGLSDGTTVNLTSTNSALTSPFEGFAAADSTSITSLSFTMPISSTNRYATIDNLYVGNKKRIPEPSNVLGILVSASVLVLARKKIKQNHERNM